MIIKGGSRSNGKFFAKHLQNDWDEKGNDRAELCEMRGVAAKTVDGFFRETAAIASGTDCKNHFYHSSLSPQLGEQLTPAQWGEAVDMLEKNLGLEGQPRFVMEHEKEGRTHRHVVWSRIDLDTMTARSDSLTYRIHERTSREIENKFDLERGHSVLEAGRETARPERRPEDWAGFRAQKTGIDPAEIKAEMSELWRGTDSGRAFAAAVAERGYVLARGDRRDVVLVDHAGDDHSLARRLAGVKAADVRARMADVDRDALPSVAEARAAQQARFTHDGRFDPSAARAAWENRHPGRTPDRAPESTPQQAPEQIRPDPPRAEKGAQDLGRDASNIRLAWSLTDSGPGFAAAMQDRGYILAAVSAEEARASERAQAFAKEIDRFKATLKQGELVAVNEYGRVTRITERTTGDSVDGIDKHLAGIDRRALMNVTDAQEVMKEVYQQQRYAERQTARPKTGIEQQISDALEGRGTYNPFTVQLHQAGLTVARATAADIEQQKTEHWERQGKLIEWDQREPPRMNEGDLFAITRTGKAFQLNPFQLDFQKIEQRISDDAQEAKRKPERFSALPEGHDFSLPSIADVRAEQQGIRSERAAKREESQAIQRDLWAFDKAVHAPQERGQSLSKAHDATGRGALSVADNLTGVLSSLADFVCDLLAGPSEPPKFNHYTFLEQIEMQERATLALESIRLSIERGDSLRGEDLRSLTPEQLKSIAARGDDAMRYMLMEVEKEREPDRSIGRER